VAKTCGCCSVSSTLELTLELNCPFDIHMQVFPLHKGVLPHIGVLACIGKLQFREEGSQTMGHGGTACQLMIMLMGKCHSGKDGGCKGLRGSFTHGSKPNPTQACRHVHDIGLQHVRGQVKAHKCSCTLEQHLIPLSKDWSCSWYHSGPEGRYLGHTLAQENKLVLEWQFCISNNSASAPPDQAQHMASSPHPQHPLLGLYHNCTSSCCVAFLWSTTTPHHTAIFFLCFTMLSCGPPPHTWQQALGCIFLQCTATHHQPLQCVTTVVSPCTHLGARETAGGDTRQATMHSPNSSTHCTEVEHLFSLRPLLCADKLWDRLKS
jgi:hypothetical protein